MNYKIKSGDNLWKIVRDNYKLNDNSKIANKVKELAEKNNIKDANLIYSGQEISLFGLGDENSQDTGDGFTKSKVDEFEDFTNGNSQTGTFQFADKGSNLKETGKNTLEFAKEYIKANSSDGKSISFEDFKNKNKELNEERAKTIYDLQDIDGKDGISAEEFASYITFLDSLDQNVDGNMSIISMGNLISDAIEALDDSNTEKKQTISEAKVRISQVKSNLYDKLDFTS